MIHCCAKESIATQSAQQSHGKLKIATAITVAVGPRKAFAIVAAFCPRRVSGVPNDSHLGYELMHLIRFMWMNLS